MDYCDLGDLQHFAATSHQGAAQVWDYLQGRLCSVGAQYFHNANIFLDILHTCDAVISGSMALHFLLPRLGMPWMPGDLDLYVPQIMSMLMLSHLMAQDFQLVTEGDDNEPYTPSNEVHVVHLTNGKCRIDIVVSGMASALSPIFHFHSTAVMNFMSTNTVFCCYPRLTLQHLSLVNVGALCNGEDTDDLSRAVGSGYSQL
ncbi:hypothetical protein EDD17DRAFT_1497039 [Pisolithus thermaeus]|nr:hypothetical protein EV401DRAFT_1881243 [Pisolithus croceorrhizus]KAI6143857.1 hypothetical protein EDD17DRAFT_1497039 [Pisolithus thermaeus]